MEAFFKLKARGTTVATEVLAGTSTFISLAYVISLIPKAFLKVAGIAFIFLLKLLLLSA